MPSHVRMTIGLAAGLMLGLAAAWTQQPALLTVARGLRPLGTLFLNLLWMVVIPLVVTALFAGVAGLGSVRRVGRLGIRTLAFFWATTLAAIVIGFAVAALSLPLAGVTPDQQAALRQSALADSDAVRHAAEQILSGARFLVELIPSNPLRAAIDGNLLPLIVATTLFAVAAAALPEEKRRTLTDLADVATAALIRIVWWVLLLAPLGIFALVAGAVAREDDGGIRGGGDRRVGGVHRRRAAPRDRAARADACDQVPEGRLAVARDGVLDHLVARHASHDARGRRRGAQDLTHRDELRA